MILLQFPLCTSILTFAPQFWHYTPSWKKRLLWRGKTQKRLPKFFLRLRDTYKKYILQKNWSKTAIPALSSGPSNLQQSIWGRHHQLDDQHRNPNINNKDHLVGQLTTVDHAKNPLPEKPDDSENKSGSGIAKIYRVGHRVPVRHSDTDTLHIWW